MKKLHLKIGTSSRNELVIEGSGIDSHHLELFCDEYKNVFIIGKNLYLILIFSKKRKRQFICLKMKKHQHLLILIKRLILLK